MGSEEEWNKPRDLSTPQKVIECLTTSVCSACVKKAAIAAAKFPERIKDLPKLIRALENCDDRIPVKWSWTDAQQAVKKSLKTLRKIKKKQSGITAAKKRYTDKRKVKLGELRALKSKRIREHTAKTKKLPKAQRGPNFAEIQALMKRLRSNDGFKVGAAAERVSVLIGKLYLTGKERADIKAALNQCHKRVEEVIENFVETEETDL